MERIAVDMDQVMCDLLTPWLNKYNREYGDSLKTSDITKWNFHELTKCGKRIYEYLDDPDLFLNLPIIEDSQIVLKKLSEKFEVFVATSPWNYRNIEPKWQWLQQHFSFIPEKNYVFARNKGIINADYLIDDKALNFVGFGGQGILFDAPHNKNEVDFPRVNNWQEVMQYFDVV